MNKCPNEDAFNHTYETHELKTNTSVYVVMMTQLAHSHIQEVRGYTVIHLEQCVSSTPDE